jgi:hypothetical protein
MRTVDRERARAFASNPEAASRQATGMPANVLQRHLRTAARLIDGGRLTQGDLDWLSELARQTNIPAERVFEAAKRINAEPNPQRRAELYAAGVGGDERAAQVGMQMTRAYVVSDAVNTVNKRIDGNKPKELTTPTLDPYWAKRYAEEAKDEKSRRTVIEDAIHKQTGYLPPSRMTFAERQANAAMKAQALADSLERNLDRPTTLRAELSSNVHADAVLTECADLGLNDGTDTLGNLAENDTHNELNARWRADE